MSRHLTASRSRWAALCVLLLSFGLMGTSAAGKSPTVDEPVHWQRGLAYLRHGATQFLLGNPVTGDALAAAGLLLAPDLSLPTDHPSWVTGDWSVAGHQFMWVLNDRPGRTAFLGRMVGLWLTMLLGALVFHWGRTWAGPVAGLSALLLTALDPNILAHGPLAKNDTVMALWFILGLYAYWRWQRGGRPRFLALAGLSLGLALITKFNGLALGACLSLLLLDTARRRRRWAVLLALPVVGLIAGLVIWSANAFALRPWPGGAFWTDLEWLLRYVGREHGAYLAGHYSSTGWWYYFPFAYVVKTPTPTLALLVATVVVGLRRGRPVWRATRFAWLPALVYLTLATVGAINIGYRYLLPITPVVALWCAVSLAAAGAGWRRLGLGAALVLPLIAVLVWPNYIPYFNLLAGGSRHGWRLLSDSNVDWGQDLPALAAWQRDDGRPLLLSYFGTAVPSRYGLHFEALPTWPPTPEQTLPARQAFFPPDPAPGLYAISVTHLHGAVLGQERDTYAFFREREPLARIGGSIFVYEVPAYGPAVNLALAGLVPADLSPATMARVGGNNRWVRWLDPSNSLMWPAGGGWLAFGAGAAPDPALVGLIPGLTTERSAAPRLLPLSPPPAWSGPPVAQFGDLLRFYGHRVVAGGVDELVLLTAWEVAATTDRPMQIFVHALAPDGQIASQWDGLGVAPSAWRVGDRFWQLHRLKLPSPRQTLSLSLGLYDGVTLNRVPVVSPAGGGDQFPLAWPPEGRPAGAHSRRVAVSNIQAAAIGGRTDRRPPEKPAKYVPPGRSARSRALLPGQGNRRSTSTGR